MDGVGDRDRRSGLLPGGELRRCRDARFLRRDDRDDPTDVGSDRRLRQPKRKPPDDPDRRYDGSVAGGFEHKIGVRRSRQYRRDRSVAGVGGWHGRLWRRHGNERLRGLVGKLRRDGDGERDLHGGGRMRQRDRTYRDRDNRRHDRSLGKKRRGSDERGRRGSRRRPCERLRRVRRLARTGLRRGPSDRHRGDIGRPGGVHAAG